MDINWCNCKFITIPDVLMLKMYEENQTQTTLSEIIRVNFSCLIEYLTGKSEPTLKVACLICVQWDARANIVLEI